MVFNSFSKEQKISISEYLGEKEQPEKVSNKDKAKKVEQMYWAFRGMFSK